MTSCARYSSSKLALCAQQGKALTVHVLASYHDYTLGLLFTAVQCHDDTMYPVNWMRLWCAFFQ